MKMIIRKADICDLKPLMSLVLQYHDFDGIQQSHAVTQRTIEDLLNNPQWGYFNVLQIDNNLQGYAAICLGYSIEFSGRDAFLDEIYITPQYQGQGFGKQLLKDILQELKRMQINALHLEINQNNKNARMFYQSLGFSSRKKFHLMSQKLVTD